MGGVLIVNDRIVWVKLDLKQTFTCGSGKVERRSRQA